jgi:hypothetical protein
LINKATDSSESTEEDSFRARVQKAFGSLSSSQTPWSLTDDQIEKREWNRSSSGGSTARNDDVTPCSSSFDGISFHHKDRKKRRVRSTLEDDGVEEDLDDGEDGGGDGGDEWEIRSSIGLDCTLDNEEEEDEFDKVAAGRENATDVLYMKDVTDHGPYLNSYNVIPSSVHDPRANLLAAKIRLEEDEIEAHKIGPNYTDDKSMSNVEEPSVKASEDGGKPKSILKRKNDVATSKEQKRVKFDPSCKDDFEEASENPNDALTGNHLVVTTFSDNSLGRSTLGVPDYACNPSKYTRYSFDSASEVDDESNSRVCMDLLELVKMSRPEDSRSLSGDASNSLPKSVTFIPRKKETGAPPRDSSSEAKQNQEDGSEQSLIQKGFPLVIAADDIESGEVRGMEDELESSVAATSTEVKKQCRNYRTRSNLDDTVT